MKTEIKRFENASSISFKFNKKDLAKFYNVFHLAKKSNARFGLKIYSNVHKSSTIHLSKFYTDKPTAEHFFEDILLNIQNFKEEPISDIYKFVKHCFKMRYHFKNFVYSLELNFYYKNNLIPQINLIIADPAIKEAYYSLGFTKEDHTNLLEINFDKIKLEEAIKLYDKFYNKMYKLDHKITNILTKQKIKTA